MSTPSTPENRTGSEGILDRLRQHLALKGAVEAGPEFNLTLNRQTGFDMYLRGGRILGYLSSKEDEENHRLLLEDQIPILTNGTYVFNSGGVAAVMIPKNATPIDTIAYTEDVFTDGRVAGAMEIMQEMGTLLAKVRLCLGGFPKVCCLSKFAFLSGEERFLRLIPPIEVDSALTIEEITLGLEESLSSSDPTVDHIGHVEIFLSAFKKTNNKLP